MSVNLSPIGGAAAQFFDNNGNPLSGGKLYTYAAGTTTPLAAYTTDVGDVAHTNPIILDSAGRVPGGQIWLTDGSVDYKFLLETSFNVLVGTFDNIPPAISGTAADIVYLPAGTGAVATTVQAVLRRSVAVEDFIVAAEADQTQAFIRAATYLCTGPKPGGTITVSGAVTITAGLINFWDILTTTQGMVSPFDYLPSGEITRGTQINLVGQGLHRSTITINGAGNGFSWGLFILAGGSRAMSAVVEGIYFKGDGVTGHVSQVIIPAGPGEAGFSTTTTSVSGTTNTTTTALYFATICPGTYVNNCHFRFLQRGVFNRYGFGLVVDNTQFLWCNVGLHIGNDATTWEVRSGCELELCAVGIYGEYAQKGTIGAAVIEANTAGCDLLFQGCRFVLINGPWASEGSLQNIVLRGDQFAASLPNGEHTYNDVVGVNIDSIGGVRNLTLTRCHMDTRGDSYSASAGEEFSNIVYDNCTFLKGPFPPNSITFAGIATRDEVSILGDTIDGSVDTYGMRRPRVRRGLTARALPTVGTCFSLTVPNVLSTTRLVINMTRVDALGSGSRTAVAQYAGLLTRVAGSASEFIPSVTDSFFEVYAATGPDAPITVSTPTIVVAGAVGGTQIVSFQFAIGTAVSNTTNTFWDCTLFPGIDGVEFSSI